MTKKLKKILKTILPIALGVFLVWYLYNSTTPEQRQEILGYITQADPLWISLSIAIGILSHISRAIRWNYLLEPLGYSPKLSNNVLIILTAYLANLGIPRSGEFLRATALATYEDVPFEKGFGTIVTERVVDVIMLLIIIFVALLLQTELIIGFIKSSGIGLFGGIIVLIISILGLFLTIRLIKKSSSKFALKLKGFLKNLLEGILSIFKMKRKWAFIFHTFLIWACYIAMFWVIKYTVLETADLSLGALLVAFVGGAIAMTTTNGGFIAYPAFVSKSLEIFGVSIVSGNAFGWIMWIAQTLMVIVFGAISFLLLPLLNRNR
ncbi:lysylphosphatidylglycerol synthase transmembrane domain-containing protein [Maribacter sp. HTCC2170]|uniref:lysylphosphatidylglycerol synthase transmembrane domain-containing protein n=1 Tax=Maribacter sp. (strain HTCC2170 / KCCM 42371) TaxID=313603 RepID=UPI00006B3AE7|nr:lysylphosphatidylglycerol synthase transmembrane domain-containing protein [Maribacter sp. HTCC2170]EAQ99756.1 putative dolichol-P-glucose synthetase [Maribacter sp. HTCC2170]